MENNVLTAEQKAALGIVDEPVPVKRGPGRPPKQPVQKTIVDETLDEVEIARQQMLASFGTETEELSRVSTNPVPTQEVDLQELLANVKIDVNKIQIVDKPSVSALADTSIKINGRPTFEAICNQSGYAAYMESLKYSDLSALENSVGGFYAGRQRLYKTIWEKINNTSVGKIDFKEFLEMTSLYDVPSLLYGIYCQTFKTEVEFNIKCSHCGGEMPIKVPNKGLILVKDEETYANIGEIMGNLSTPQEAMAHAIMNKRTKVVVPDSKMLFELKIPSLYKYLDVVGSVKPEKFEEMQTILGMMVFIDKAYKLDIATLVKTGEVKYYPVEDKKEIAKIVSELELADSTELQKIIAQETNKYAIEYAIKGMTCRHCKTNIETIPVDMEELTFFRIEQM